VLQATEEFLVTREPERVIFATKRDELAGIYQTYLRREAETIEKIGYRMEGPIRVDPYTEFMLTRVRPTEWISYLAISKQVELARAKRALRRMEEDAPLLRVRIVDFPLEAQTLALRHFESTLLEQKDIIRDLETQIRNGSLSGEGPACAPSH
jgi:hypothetical protein